MKKLLTLFTLLLTVCSGAWAAAGDSASDPATKTLNKMTFLDVANTPTNANITTGSVGVVTYGLYYLCNQWKPAWVTGNNNASSSAEGANSFTAQGFLGEDSPSSGTNAEKAASTGIGSVSIKNNSSYIRTFKVTGISGAAIIAKDHSDSNHLIFKIEKYNAEGTSTTEVQTITNNSTSYGVIPFTETLDASEYYLITITATHTSNNSRATQIRFTPGAAGVTKPTFSPASGGSLVKNSGNVTITGATGNTVYYKWSQTNNAYTDGETLAAAAAEERYGTNTVNAAIPSTTGTWYLYAVAKDGNDYSDVVKATYTITNPSYTVTLNTNGGTINAGNVTEYVEGTGATLPYNVTKDCYTFAGWYDNSGLTGVAVTTISTEATGNKEYWAKWTPLYTTGTYTFENNATVGTEPSKTVTTDAIAYNAFRVDNMFFSDMTIQYESGEAGLANYCGWKIKTNDATIKFLVENDAEVTIGLGTIGSKGGAKINYTNQSGVATETNLSAQTDNEYSVKGGTLVTITSTNVATLTLKRIVVVASAAKFDVTYKANGSDEEDVVRNVSKVDENMFTYAGHSFTGWNTDADGNGDDYAVGADVTSTLTLFAQWISTYTVEFNLQGHGSAIDAQEVAEGGKVTEPTAPTADGWVFGGWYEESTCENEFDFNTTINADKTLYAKWTEDVKVSAFSLSFVNTSDYKMSEGDNNDLTASEVSVTGGSASIRFWNNKTNTTVLESDSKKIYYSTGNMNLKLVLNTPLKVGDVISFAGGDGNQIAITDTDESPNSSSNKEVTESYSYTVKAGDHLVGKSTIYVGRGGGSSTRHGAITITSAAANVTVSNLGIEGEKDYATMYYGTVAMAVPAGVKAKTYKVVDGKLTVSRTYENGSEYDVIPAGEAVVLEADVDANTPYMFSVSSTTTEPDGANLLRGTDVAQTINAAGYKYYKLAKNNAGTKVGFYYAVEDGVSITNGAHKAYLAVPTGSGEAKEYFVLGGEDETSSEATAISAVEIEIANGATLYNLAGQKVGKDYKGIIVVNGKKYVRK